MASTDSLISVLDEALELHPLVSLRNEPFGALAYHSGNRRLVFLQHPDIVRVARDLASHDTLAAALTAHGIAPARWHGFERAFISLKSSEVVRER